MNSEKLRLASFGLLLVSLLGALYLWELRRARRALEALGVAWKLHAAQRALLFAPSTREYAQSFGLRGGPTLSGEVDGVEVTVMLARTRTGHCTRVQAVLPGLREGSTVTIAPRAKRRSAREAAFEAAFELSASSPELRAAIATTELQAALLALPGATKPTLRCVGYPRASLATLELEGPITEPAVLDAALHAIAVLCEPPPSPPLDSAAVCLPVT